MLRIKTPLLLALIALSQPVSSNAADALCETAYPVAEPPAAVDSPDDADQLTATADSVELQSDGSSLMKGNVTVRHGDNAITASELLYDGNAGQVMATGGAQFRNESIAVNGDAAVFYSQLERGSFTDAEFSLAEGGRGSASSIQLDAGQKATLEDVSYTTCPPGNRSWMLNARKIELNAETGLGSAKHARLLFHRVPILYAPYFYFPIDDRRRTGLLAPTFGSSDSTGFDFKLPVYVNLAPNRDLTISPRYLSRRGALLDGEFRYLNRRSEGELEVQHLDDDAVTNTDRSGIRFAHQGLLSNDVRISADYNEVSDNFFYEDLGAELDVASITHLTRELSLEYAHDHRLQASLSLLEIQSLDSTLAPADEPYSRMPQLRLRAVTPSWRDTLSTGMELNYSDFRRDATADIQRLHVAPFVAATYDRPSGYVSARAVWHESYYQIDRDPSVTSDRSLRRSLPSFNLDAGLRFLRASENGASQTFEPRLFFVSTAYRSQSALPVLDTGEPDFDFLRILTPNRFTGVDRISDENRLATTVTSRLLNRDGRELFRATIGQSFRFERSDVTLPTGTDAEAGAADIIADAAWRPGRDYSARGLLQWDGDSRKLQRVSTAMEWRYHPRGRVRLGYRYRSGVLEQTDLTTVVPINPRWKAIAQWRRSLRDNDHRETLFGMEYATCCWALRGAWRQYLSNSAGDFNTAFYLQLELTGLGRLGDGLEALLERDMLGPLSPR